MNNDTHKEPEQLEREVRAARDQLSNTVDEISNRLSPGELLDQALNVTKGYGGEFAKNLGQQAKDNPLALMVTGIGMSWMMLGDQQKNGANEQPNDSVDPASFEPNYATSFSDIGYAAKGQASADANANGESLGSTLDQHMPDKEQVKGYAQAAQTQLQRTLQEQPLMAGALGVALGAALGALIPPSEAEDRFMGKTSDEVTEKTAAVASEQYKGAKENLKQKANDVADQIKSDSSTIAGNAPKA